MLAAAGGGGVGVGVGVGAGVGPGGGGGGVGDGEGPGDGDVVAALSSPPQPTRSAPTVADAAVRKLRRAGMNARNSLLCLSAI